MKVLNGNALLPNVAADALRRWRDQPSPAERRAHSIHVSLTITFGLNQRSGYVQL
jgi:hypothetical protein